MIGEGNECQRGPWAPKRGEFEIAFFIKAWKPLSSKCVIKTLRGSPKGKAQREQYLLTVDLGYYTNHAYLKLNGKTKNQNKKVKQEECSVHDHGQIGKMHDN